MRHVLTIGVLGLLVSIPANAQDASLATVDTQQRQKAAEQMVFAMHLDRQFDAIIPQVVSMMMGAFIRGNVGKDDEIRKILNEEMSSAFNNRQNELIANARDVYAHNFTVEQLNDMTAFYNTPTGKILTEKLPEVTQQSMQGGAVIGQKAAQDALPHILERMRAAQLAIPQGS